MQISTLIEYGSTCNEPTSLPLQDCSVETLFAPLLLTPVLLLHQWLHSFYPALPFLPTETCFALIRQFWPRFHERGIASWAIVSNTDMYLTAQDARNIPRFPLAVFRRSKALEDCSSRLPSMYPCLHVKLHAIVFSFLASSSLIQKTARLSSLHFQNPQD